MKENKKQLTLSEKLFKISKICLDINFIKEGYNEEGKYFFVEESKVKQEIVPLLIEHNIRLSIEKQVIRTEGVRQVLCMYYCFINMDNQDDVISKVFEIPIENISMGGFVASTGAIKYILLNEFLIATREEKDNSVGLSDEKRKSLKKNKNGIKKDINKRADDIASLVDTDDSL